MDAKIKAGRYLRIYDQIETLLAKPGNDISKMATIVAVLHNKFDYFFWTGFYLLHYGELIAGPYQGPVACQLLEKDKGVCWAAINSGKAVIVHDVNDFPGHIACDSRSKSEIAIPFKNYESKIIGVLDVDSKELNSFDEIDREGLERILCLLEKNCGSMSTKN